MSALARNTEHWRRPHPQFPLAPPRCAKCVYRDTDTHTTCGVCKRKKVLLQRLGAASVLLLPAPQLALYATGLDRDVSGLVVQVGYSETTVLPVCSRLPLVQSASIAKLGSRALHLCLHSLALEVRIATLLLFVTFIIYRQNLLVVPSCTPLIAA